MERSEIEKQRRHFELKFANKPQMSNESKFQILIMKPYIHRNVVNSSSNDFLKHRIPLQVKIRHFALRVTYC